MNNYFTQAMNAKLQSNNRDAQAQENAARAAAAGNVGAAREGATGSVLGTIWGQPGNFAGVMGNVYGNMAGNVGAQGGNYADAYGSLAGGVSAIGNTAGQNYAAYAQGLGNLANMSSQERSNLYGSMAMAEAARQGAVGNIGSSALGAYGGAANAALGAYGLQQQAYNMGLSQLGAANQNALSGVGQSRNAALANLGNGYAGVAGSAAQLGAAGLGASQYNNVYSATDQFARDRQETGASGQSYGRDSATMYGGDGGGSGQTAFQATGPGGTIASGSYDGGGGGGYEMGGNRNSSSGLSQSNYGVSESEARQSTRQGQQQGPQMDAFRASLNAGMSGIGEALSGLQMAQNDVRTSGDMGAISADYQRGLDSLNSANSVGRQIPGQMLGQALDGLLRLGGQGYNNSRKGMDQFYGNAQGVQSDSDRYLGNLNAGYANASGQVGGLAGLLAGGYRDANRNIASVQSEIRSGANDARSDVQGLYDTSVGSWMQGNYNPYDARAPMFNQAEQDRRRQDNKIRGERYKLDDAVRAAKQNGEAFDYVVNELTGRISRNTSGTVPLGHIAITGNQAADMLQRRGAGPNDVYGATRAGLGRRGIIPGYEAPALPRVPLHPDIPRARNGVPLAYSNV